MPAAQKRKRNASSGIFQAQDVLKEDYAKAGSQLDNLFSVPKRMDGMELSQNVPPAETAPKQEQEESVSGKTSPAVQMGEPIPAEIDTNAESFKEIKALYEQKLHGLMDKAEGPISNREKFQVLFDILKKDGELGIKYELGDGRETRTPQEVLDTKAADCNEFALLFAVCAKKLEIDITDISMAVMDVHLQSGRSTPGHAALITSKEGSYLIDPAYLGKVEVFHPKDPKNIKSAEIRDFYTHVPSGEMVRGIAITQKAESLREMYAINLMETVGTYKKKLETAAKSEAAEYRLKIIGVLENVLEVNNTDLLAQRKLMYYYMVQADEAFETAKNSESTGVKQRYLEVASHYCEKALKLYEKCQSQYIGKEESEGVKDIKQNAHHAHEIRYEIYAEQGKVAEALSEFDEMIKIKPKEVNAYSNKLKYLFEQAVAANRGQNPEQEEKYLREARKVGEFALEQLKGNYFAETEIKSLIREVDEQLERFEKQN